MTTKYVEIPPATPPGTCRGCAEVIYWTVSDKGSRVPVSIQTDGGQAPTATEPGRGVNHFTNCPQASQFHKRRR